MCYEFCKEVIGHLNILLPDRLHDSSKDSMQPCLPALSLPKDKTQTGERSKHSDPGSLVGDYTSKVKMFRVDSTSDGDSDGKKPDGETDAFACMLCTLLESAAALLLLQPSFTDIRT